MTEKNKIKILKSQGSKEEYIIKDKNGINIGRFKIIDFDEENQKCDVRLKYYRVLDENLLSDVLYVMLETLFKKKYIFKVNMFIAEGINIAPFLNIGFVIEGIVSDNLIVQEERHQEILLGINKIDYNNKKRVTVVEIPSKRVRIKVLTVEDAEEVLKYYIRNKEHLEKVEPLRDKKFYTLEIQKNIIQEGYRQFLNGTSMECGIFIENKLIGIIKLSNVVYGIFKNGIIGYSIDKEQEGKGYMKEALMAVIEYAFKEMRLHRIEASALVENERSKGVLKACGFKELGVNEKYLFINGKWRDHITYYKTN
ncbi:MAG: GNAT family N-acetyltransferase [Clostridium sp.]|nr:GNAT family N-acetyltransferase [Clostridium sp.]MDY3828561.1 GNAT family protein [Clostridium sp.]